MFASEKKTRNLIVVVAVKQLAFEFPFFNVSLAMFSVRVHQRVPSNSTEAVYAIADVLLMAMKSL